MAFKYSVILDVLAMGGNDVFKKPREVLGAVKEAGLDAVDVGTANVGEPDKMKEVVDLARSLGLQVAAFLGAWAVWHGGEERDLASSDDGVRKNALDYAKKCVDMASDMGADVFEICAAPGVNTYPASKIPPKVLRENFSRSATDLCQYAEKRKVTIILEPINRFEGHPGFMNSLVDAARIVEGLGLANLGVMGDLFHMNIEDSSICDAFRAAGKNLKHIHLADSNRQVPGTGHVDFKAMLKTLEDIGFTGYMSLDCVPPKPDMKTFLRSSMDYMKAVERSLEIEKRISATQYL